MAELDGREGNSQEKKEKKKINYGYIIKCYRRDNDPN